MHFTDFHTRLAAYALLTDGDRVLLTWFNGSATDQSGWSLPGGGVDYDESLEQAAVRETKEEAGYDVELGRPILTHSFTGTSHHTGGPFKSVRVVYEATIVGGELGTLEVGGTTDFARWVTPSEIDGEHRADLVDLAIAAHRSSPGTTGAEPELSTRP